MEELPARVPVDPSVTVHSVAESDLSADSFRTLVRGAARDAGVRSHFAAILEACDLPLEERKAIWRSFETAAAEGLPSEPTPAAGE